MHLNINILHSTRIYPNSVNSKPVFTSAGYSSKLKNLYFYFCYGRCDEKSLEDSFCKRVMVTRGEAITKWLDPNSAALSRDALAKIVYSRLFDW